MSAPFVRIPRRLRRLGVRLVLAAITTGAVAWTQPLHAERHDGYGDPLPDGAIARLGSVRLRHPPFPHSLAFTPDGKILVSQSQESVRVWDLKTGRERFRVSRPNTYFGAGTVAVSLDGKVLAVVLAGHLHLWSLRTEKEVPLPAPVGDSLSTVAFVPGSGHLLTESWPGNEGQLTCWDLERGKRLFRVSALGLGAISPDGKSIASGGRTIRIWDVAARKDACIIDGKSPPHALAFCKGGKVLAAGGADGAVALWDRETGKQVAQLKGHDKPVYSLAAFPDGKTLASGAQDGTIRLWDLDRARESRRIGSRAHNVVGLAASPDGGLLATAASDGVIRLWDARTGKEQAPYPGPTAAPKWVRFCPDSQTLVTVGGHRIGLWEARSGRAKAIFEDHVDEDGLDLSPDGKRLATVSYREGLVHVYALPSGKECRRFEKAHTLGVAFSPDGKTLAIDEDRSLRLWDLTQSDKNRSLSLQRNTRAQPLVFSPDGKTLFVSGGPVRGHILRSLDVATGKERWQAGPVPASFYSLAVSPDGRLLAAAGDDGLVILYDTATGKEVRRCPGNPNRIIPVVFSPDGRMLATGCLDKTLHLWEVATGEQRRCITDFEAGVTQLSFSPDGRLLASCCYYGSTVLVWDLMKLTGNKGAHGRLDAGMLEAHWKDLGGRDAARAYRAILTLAGSPERALPFLTGRLRPVRAADAEHVKNLLQRLDGSDFTDRQKAAQELERLGFSAEPALRKALAAGPELEARRRIERLLHRLEATPTLQVVRAIEALELAGTPEARKLLETLAMGAAEARPTQEAKATLERLRRQP